MSRTRASFVADSVENRPRLWDFRKKDMICIASDYKPMDKDAASITCDLPYIVLVEYMLDASSILTAVNRSLSILAQSQRTNENPFFALYAAHPSDNVYVLPYYNTYHHQTTQTWQEPQGVISQGINSAVAAVVDVFKILTPAAGYLFPKSYAGAIEGVYTVTFSLLNTVVAEDGSATDTSANIQKNKQFLEMLINQNLHAQAGVIVVDPPPIYEVLIPGIRWSPAAVIEGLQIRNRGTLNNWNNYIVPDAWEVTIQIRELINECRNLYNVALQGYDEHVSSQTDVRAIVDIGTVLEGPKY